MTDSTSDLAQFRQQVRQFLAEALPDDIRASTRSQALVTREQARRWQQILHRQGWAAPSWPQRYGGTGWSLSEQAVFKEELAASDAPHAENLGIDTIGPTLMRFGTEAQCERFLPGMLSFDDYWAQGYSEPDAGSDLAALKTSARQQGDTWVLNGSKIWQSLGHWANWAIVLARSQPRPARKQEGISVFLVDLGAPGVTVRPIKYIHGAPFHVQIFFDNVQVPADQLVGQVDQGWQIAKGLLVIERLFVARVAECKAGLARLQAEMDRRLPATSATAAPHHALLRSRLAALLVRGEALAACWAPAVAQAEAGGSPALEASLLKLDGIELLQDIQLLDMDLRGQAALRLSPAALQGLPASGPGEVDGNAALAFWRYRGSSLAGGSTEVQLGIVAKAVQGGQSALHQADATPISHELEMLQDSLRAWLARHYSFELRQQRLRAAEPAAAPGADPVLAALAEFGVLVMALPEALGGLGRPAAEAIRLQGVLAQALLIEPVFWQSILPSLLLQTLAAQPQRDALLSELAAGTERMGVLLAQAGEGSVRAARLQEGDGWALAVQAPLVMGAAQYAGLLLLAGGERCEDAQLFVLTQQQLAACQADGSLQAFALHDGRPAYSLHTQALRVGDSQRLAHGADAVRAMQEARSYAELCLCAESVALCRVALRDTVDYLGTRQQFSQPLAGFQVLQHRLADLYRQWNKAHHYLHAVLQEAATLAPAERARSAAKLKHLCGVAGRRMALDVLQLHGAIGFQDETPISHMAKRIFNNDLLLGGAQQPLERLTDTKY